MADPLNRARQIVDDRLVRLVPDGLQRWDVATAIVTNLDMAGLIVTSEERDLVAENAELRQDWSMHEAAWKERVAELEAALCECCGDPDRSFQLTDEGVVPTERLVSQTASSVASEHD